MTPRERVHRAFYAAKANAPEDPTVPACYLSDPVFGAHPDAPACGVLCDRMTDTIQFAQAETARDCMEALRGLLVRREAKRQGNA